MPTSPQLGGSPSRPVGARLQFRFADGSARSNSFPKDATLRDAANWLLEKLQTERASSPPLESLNAVRTVEQLRLELVYPRRSFAPDQLDRPLSELGLVPSAVLLVTAAARAGLTGALKGATGDGVVGLLVWIYTMFLSLLVFLVGPLRKLFERSPTASASASSTTTTRASTGTAHERSGGLTGGATAGGLRQRPGPARRPAGEQEGNESVYRSIRSPSGNVRQFRPESPDDDPSATWNGNSTQQQ